MKLVVLVTRSETELDDRLFWRFYWSLNRRDTDTPSYKLIEMGQEYSMNEARIRGSEECLKTDAEYMLLSDTDCVLPALWWQTIENVFKTDERIVIVGPMIRGTITHKLQIPTNRTPKDAILDLGQQYMFDGFVVFRMSYLRESGVRPDGGITWFRDTIANGYRVVVTTSVIVDHFDVMGLVKNKSMIDWYLGNLGEVLV